MPILAAALWIAPKLGSEKCVRIWPGYIAALTPLTSWKPLPKAR